MLNRYSEDGARDPAFRKIAENLYGMLYNRLGRPPTAYELLHWLMERVHDFVDYTPDFEGREIFQPVQSTVWNGQGRTISPITGRRKGADDCEGLAAVVVSWAIALGIRAGNVWNDQPGAAQNHVLGEACSGGTYPVDWTGCIPIETTIPGAFPGESTAQAINRIGPVYRSRITGGTKAAGDVSRTTAPGTVRTGVGVSAGAYRRSESDVTRRQAVGNAGGPAGAEEVERIRANTQAQLRAIADEAQARYGSPPLPQERSAIQRLETEPPRTSKTPLVVGLLVIGGLTAWALRGKNK